MEIINFIASVFIVALLLVDKLKSMYKITYYQQRLKNNGLEDTVKDMTFIKMFTE